MAKSQGMVEKLIRMQETYSNRQRLGYGKDEKNEKSKYVDLSSPIICLTCGGQGHTYEHYVKNLTIPMKNMNFVTEKQNDASTSIFISSSLKAKGSKQVWVPRQRN
ncbi:hypothetical protein Dimus_039791 [Dionaea muscipula]